MLITRRRMLSGTALLGGAILTGCNGEENSSNFGTFIRDPEPPVKEIIDPVIDEVRATVAQPIPLTDNWTFRPAVEILTERGEDLSGAEQISGFEPAVVPGTPLTSMIENKKYPDALYRNIVTESIPDDLSKTNYWYHTHFKFPAIGADQRQWIRFDGINYLADIWINGQKVGSIEGAFMRGIFDVTDIVGRQGGDAYMAVLIHKWDFDEDPILPSLTSNRTRGGRNGGRTGIALKNGPTFFCSSGWDWLPTVPDRNYGIWQPVSHYVTGPVWFGDVQVNTVLSDDLKQATVKLSVPVKHLGAGGTDDKSYSIRGTFGDIEINYPIALSPEGATDTFEFELIIENPELWWPNGYGKPHLYELDLQAYVDDDLSDTYGHKIGIRKFGYIKKSAMHDRQLCVVVNNHPILAMGGNWGLDEAFKRIPKEKIYHAVKLHRDANLNMIRNWNGQSTSEDLFAACDEYGILVWQDFFYSTEGGSSVLPGNPDRAAENMRDCILRYRNHASIFIWCGGNEGAPNQVMIDHLARLVTELDPAREYITSSAGDLREESVALAGFRSGGPYHFVGPRSRFQRVTGTDAYAFHNELGSYSIPTLEFTKKMIPEAKWECPDNSWADRDFNANGGNSGGLGLIRTTGSRYGTVRNLPDFIRKSQMMNFEEHRAIYESHVAKMLNDPLGSVSSPATGALLWMTHPAQPSFVWQMYSHDHETFGTFFAIKNACTRVTALLNASDKKITVANHTVNTFNGSVRVTVCDLKGNQKRVESVTIQKLAPATHRDAITIGESLLPADSEVMIASVELFDASGVLMKESIYWLRIDGQDNNFSSMDQMDKASLSLSAVSKTIEDDSVALRVSIRNRSNVPSLMNHLQIYDKVSGDVIAKAEFSDNYISLQGHSAKTVEITLPADDAAKSTNFAVRLDGWNINHDEIEFSNGAFEISLNADAENYNPATATFNTCTR